MSTVDVTPERLFAASEAVLRTLRDFSTRGDGPWPYIPDLCETPECPAEMKGFTEKEANHACTFLHRIGFITISPTP